MIARGLLKVLEFPEAHRYASSLLFPFRCCYIHNDLDLMLLLPA